MKLRSDGVIIPIPSNFHFIWSRSQSPSNVWCNLGISLISSPLCLSLLHCTVPMLTSLLYIPHKSHQQSVYIFSLLGMLYIHKTNFHASLLSLLISQLLRISFLEHWVKTINALSLQFLSPSPTSFTTKQQILYLYSLFVYSVSPANPMYTLDVSFWERDLFFGLFYSMLHL